MDAPSPRDSKATPPGTGGGGRHRLLALMLLLACLGGIGVFALGGSTGAKPGAQAPPSPAQAANADPAATERKALAPRRRQERPKPDDLASVITPGTPAPSMGEVIDGLHRAGIRTGLGAFNPPGTSPPLVGLAVPDDLVLPEGYVRHYQATDDGQAIEPILMYSPDYEFVDDSGQPVQVPADRVVPASHAPPGLPIRLVRIPAPRDAGGSP